MPRCKNPTSRQESAAEEGERPWRREGSKYIHIQTGLAFDTGESAERFHNTFLTKEIVSRRLCTRTSSNRQPMPRGDSPSLISYVDGKTIFIDGAGLTSLFGLRRGEITENFDETFQDEAIWRQLGLDHRDLKFRNSSNPSVINLTLIQRVQQYIFSYVLLPHDSNHGVVNKDDIRLFHVLLNNVKFDWVHFFIVALSDGTRFSHLCFAIPIMHILAHCKIDLTRDTQVPVKKTCYIKDTRFSWIVYREERDAAPNLDLVVADEEESQNETQAESSHAEDLGDSSLVVVRKVAHLSNTLRMHEKEYVLEKPIPPAPPANALKAVKDAYEKHIKDDNQVSCVMLATMTTELQKHHHYMKAHDMIVALRQLYQGQSRDGRFLVSKALFSCKLSPGNPVGLHVLKMIGYITNLEKLEFTLQKELATNLILQLLTELYKGFVMNYMMHDLDKPLPELLKML
ncbi:unnamed protein product [Cuscuta campestris]|uniref:Uncharacterized protein n=1 Tax=Cuscuta campestris TaxID=132261 RepID=A0A484LXH6_9ASTE|nr:unnamed protein product [Cuscuta campestris]